VLDSQTDTEVEGSRLRPRDSRHYCLRIHHTRNTNAGICFGEFLDQVNLELLCRVTPSLQQFRGCVWGEVNEPALRGGDHSLCPIHDLELSKDVLEMDFHRVFNDVQARSDLLVP